MFVAWGTFTHAIDAKGRTSLPVKFRDAMVAAGEPKLVLTQYPHWKAVQALPLSEWKRLEEKLLQASPLDARKQRDIMRFYSTAQEVDLDGPGRVLIPPALREYASLAKDVVWVGAGRHMYLWDKASYEAYLAFDHPAEVVDFFET